MILSSDKNQKGTTLHHCRNQAYPLGGSWNIETRATSVKRC